MQARTETGQQCCVDEKCKLAPYNLCIMCHGAMCDDHTDSRWWRNSNPMKSFTGYVCLVCVPIEHRSSNGPQPVEETRMEHMTISLEDCMRLQRVLENLK
jgi:hypothetical protein